MLLVTEGAGFIGSNVVAALNEAGRADIAVCNVLGSDAKWRNLAECQLADVVPPAEIAAWPERLQAHAVIHMGAISETTATDGGCRSQQLPVFYASFRRTSRRRLAASPRSRTRFQFTSRTSSIGRIATADRSIVQR